MKDTLIFVIDGKTYYTTKFKFQDMPLPKKLKPKTPNKGIEFREFPRKCYAASVDYAIEDRLYHDFSRDISVGGIFIETKEKFHIGQQLSMSIPVKKDDKPIRVKGIIVRVADDGIGVAFMKRRVY